MTDPVFDIFREEAREHFAALEKGFLDLESADLQTRRPFIDSLFRHAHSLKGDARAIGVLPLQSAAQVLEDVLDAMRTNPGGINADAINKGLAQLDVVRKAYDVWQLAMDSLTECEANDDVAVDPGPTFVDDFFEIKHEPMDDTAERRPKEMPATTAAAVPNEAIIRRSDEPDRQTASGSAEINSSALRDESFTVRVPAYRLDRMLNLAGEIRISQRTSDSVEGWLEILRDSLEQLPLGSHRRIQAADHNLAQLRMAIVHWQSQMSDQIRHIERELRKKATREELLVQSLEADIRNARLLPLVMLTDSLRRSIRELAQSLGKSIRYEVDVGKIMLDKVVIEALREPLLHLIRNAADHGLESSAERSASGKPTEGRILIEAERQGEMVAISISDDGRGIDYEKIRDRIRQMDETPEAEILALTPDELTAYLFQPGFSTAQAGNISGRGVGLDVVQTCVNELHGTLELVSGTNSTGTANREPRVSGFGTKFIIKVPITISAVRILTVLAGGQYYGIPTSAITRTGSASEDLLRELEGGLVLSVEGQPVRWVTLCDLLRTIGSTPANSGAMRPYLLVEHEGRKVAVVVDDLEDESEVLLKPLGFPLSGLAGVMGGTVRPDGSVQVVLNISNVAFGRVEPRQNQPARRRQLIGRIMVVDDSPTTRSILRNVFTAAGFMVRTACDGVDALERLRSQLVDLVVSDVEMPRMNGLDLTRQIKSRLGIPVILVTGKEKEEHRIEGLEAGADAYVVKSSFEGDGLLEVVRQFF